jgi:hypothetical protein
MLGRASSIVQRFYPREHIGPGKSAHRQLGLAGFPHADNAVSQDLRLLAEWQPTSDSLRQGNACKTSYLGPLH